MEAFCVPPRIVADADWQDVAESLTEEGCPPDGWPPHLRYQEAPAAPLLETLGLKTGHTLVLGRVGSGKTVGLSLLLSRRCRDLIVLLRRGEARPESPDFRVPLPLQFDRAAAGERLAAQAVRQAISLAYGERPPAEADTVARWLAYKTDEGLNQYELYAWRLERFIGEAPAPPRDDPREEALERKRRLGQVNSRAWLAEESRRYAGIKVVFASTYEAPYQGLFHCPDVFHVAPFRIREIEDFIRRYFPDLPRASEHPAPEPAAPIDPEVLAMLQFPSMIALLCVLKEGGTPERPKNQKKS